MSAINLFPDQASHIDNLRHAMRSHKRVLLQAATGWGKTVGAAYMMSEAARKGHSSFFVVPRRQLLEQTAQSLSEYGIGFGFIAAGKKANPFQHIQLCTSGTLARRLDKLPFIPKIIFIDETHYGGGEIDSIVKFFHAAGSWVIGLSATPMKINGIHMSDWYDHMVVGPQIGELMRMGRLSGYRLLAPSRPDLSGVSVRNGEYVESQLSSRMESDTVLTGNMAKHYKEQAFGKLNMAFGVSIRHVELMSEAFSEAGVPSASVHSKMPDDEIKRRIKAFARRELLTLVSKDLAIFGFDLAASAGMDVTVEALTDGRPTESLPLQLQKWGRGLRRKAEPCWIFDHAGNSISADGSLKHGYPDDDRNWTLDREEKRTGEGSSKTIPVRQCEKCYGVMRPKPICQFCGHVFPISERTISEVDGDLIEVSRADFEQVKRDERMNQGRARTLPELIELGKRRGVSNPLYWAKKVIEGRRKS